MNPQPTSNKKLWIIAAIVVVVIAIVHFSGGSDKKVIKIGVVAPLTGPGSTFGNSFVNAIKLAEEDTASTTKYKYEVIVEDDGTNPAQAASAAQKLVAVDKVQVLFSMTSGTGNAVKTIATANKIPHICGCSDITVANTEYNFTHLILPDDEATGWLTEAKKKGIKSIVILHQNQAGINMIVASVVKLAASFGVTVLDNEQFDPTTRDFKTMIGKARLLNPDFYYVVAFPPSEDIIGQQLKDLGIKNISSSAGFGIAAKPEIFEGLWYNDANVADIAFRTRFEKEFPSIRFNVRSAPFGYDMYRMVVNGEESGKDLYAYLSGLTVYDGMAGKVTKEAGTRNFHSAPGFWIVKNGKAELLHESTTN